MNIHVLIAKLQTLSEAYGDAEVLLNLDDRICDIEPRIEHNTAEDAAFNQVPHAVYLDQGVVVAGDEE